MAPHEGFKDTYTQYIRNKQYFATIRINENTQDLHANSRYVKSQYRCISQCLQVIVKDKLKSQRKQV